ncbi:hypothetical protein GGR34_002626 [Microvirga flocculans]|uniref:Uncharacterized protein n=1 Tax=Microvirga flocculans TaxID=217168 RepID=A0A7W6N8Q6_9HYPH|nr:hypothetical protein [Microvirga flocculans]MBB4040967.1 hypothetical protein [Microvirga flocculans]
MKRLAILAGAGFVVLGGIGAAIAQPAPVSGTPDSPFPYAAPHEIRWINGVPCRTVYEPGSGARVAVACAGPVAGVNAPMAPAGPMARMPGDVVTTGSIRPAPMGPAPMGPVMGVPASGTPASPFPYAAPHEIRWINGVPCRTVIEPGSGARVPIACAR